MTWRRPLALCVAMTLAMGAATQAEAVCMYRGVLYAKSTITGEFRESSLVIKGTVIENYEVETTQEENAIDDYVIARIRVDAVMKGDVGREVLLISRRNSGGFYIDPGVQYLLFLDPPVRAGWSKGYRRHQVAPLQTLPRPRYVNNACGQSVPWAEVSPEKRKVLVFETRRLSQK